MRPLDKALIDLIIVLNKHNAPDYTFIYFSVFEKLLSITQLN